MFIDEILSGAPSMTTTSTTTTLGASDTNGAGGFYPKLSPLQVYVPGITTMKDVIGEDNGLRQMRERELRKEESARVAAQTMRELKEMINTVATTATSTNEEDMTETTTMVDAQVLMKKLEELMVGVEIA